MGFKLLEAQINADKIVLDLRFAAAKTAQPLRRGRRLASQVSAREEPSNGDDKQAVLDARGRGTQHQGGLLGRHRRQGLLMMHLSLSPSLFQLIFPFRCIVLSCLIHIYLL